MGKSKNEKIDADDWTLFDRFMYGGLGYGNFCLPTNIFRIIATVIFPPLGTLIKHLKIDTDFPWITGKTIMSIIENIDDIIYTTILTALFYIPGLIYALSDLECSV
tara:strand:+ start:664 stop:981 length:318 start_codon:yes stop_codon:yes gene_type:complete